MNYVMDRYGVSPDGSNLASACRRQPEREPARLLAAARAGRSVGPHAGPQILTVTFSGLQLEVFVRYASAALDLLVAWRRLVLECHLPIRDVVCILLVTSIVRLGVWIATAVARATRHVDQRHQQRRCMGSSAAVKALNTDCEGWAVPAVRSTEKVACPPGATGPNCSAMSPPW